jgi:hypothetical protein
MRASQDIRVYLYNVLGQAKTPNSIYMCVMAMPLNGAIDLDCCVYIFVVVAGTQLGDELRNFSCAIRKQKKRYGIYLTLQEHSVRLRACCSLPGAVEELQDSKCYCRHGDQSYFESKLQLQQTWLEHR